jgi:hypothetical protein
MESRGKGSGAGPGDGASPQTQNAVELSDSTVACFGATSHNYAVIIGLCELLVPALGTGLEFGVNERGTEGWEKAGFRRRSYQGIGGSDAGIVASGEDLHYFGVKLTEQHDRQADLSSGQHQLWD